MVAEFYPNNEYGGNATNWWVPTVNCLAQMVLAAGFDEAQGWKLTEKPREMPHLRGFVHGRKMKQST
jgi:tRNA (mo5U34)-methyltransferase